MAYVIKKNAGVWRPVRWDEAVDGGGIETREISVKFRRVGVTEAGDLNTRAGTGDLKMAQFAGAVVLDWANVYDAPAAADGSPLPFTTDGLAAMLDVTGFSAGLELAFWQMVGAVADDRAKNLTASPGTGPAAGEATAGQAPGTPA